MEMITHESMMPAAAAACLLAWLEARGAIARLEGDEDDVRVDLDLIVGMTQDKAALLAQAILGLRDEVRCILRARRVAH